MKIRMQPNTGLIPKEYACGTTTFASYERIIRTMIASGEIRVSDNWEVTSIHISEHGLIFGLDVK